MTYELYIKFLKAFQLPVLEVWLTPSTSLTSQIFSLLTVQPFIIPLLAPFASPINFWGSIMAPLGTPEILYRSSFYIWQEILGNALVNTAGVLKQTSTRDAFAGLTLQCTTQSYHSTTVALSSMSLQMRLALMLLQIGPYK